jgi:tetratricopeptide (TPR) repeat protein
VSGTEGEPGNLMFTLRRISFAIALIFLVAASGYASEGKGDVAHFIELGKMLEFNANLELAQKAYMQALSIDPNSAEAHKGLARVNSHLGKTDKAVQELQSVSELTLEDETDCILTARNLRKQGHAHAAVTLLKSACEKKHNDSVLDRELAFSFLEAGESTKAVEQFHKLIQEEPNVVENYLGLAIADFRSGNTADSEADIAKVLAMNPDEPNALCLKADFALSKGDRVSAIDCYEKAISISPNLTKPYVSLANLYLQADENEKAHEILVKAQKLCPPEADVLIGLAVVEERKHSSKSALELYQQALDVESDIHRKEEIRHRIDEVRASDINH